MEFFSGIDRRVRAVRDVFAGMLVDLAKCTDGVLGARMTGAGFGGCTVSLVHRDAVDALRERLESDYAARFDLEPGIYVLEGNREAGPIDAGT